MTFDALTRTLLSAALATGLASAAASAAPALVAPTFLLDYTNAHVIDYRPTINAAGTRIVFERQFPNSDGRYGPTFLEITGLDPIQLRKLVTPGGSARADWCWFKDQPWADGPIAYSDASGIHTLSLTDEQGAPKPLPIATPNPIPGSATWIYPSWFAGCQSLAVDATEALPLRGVSTAGGAPETYAVNVTTGSFAGSLSGQSLWAGFPSVNRQVPGFLAFAGQQFTPEGYNQDQNYVYIADFALKPPAVRPLDRGASTQSFDPRYQGRAPVWSPDGLWIAFESNRNCENKSLLAVYIQDGLGLRPANQVTACSFNVQHPKWYRHRVDGRVMILASALLYPNADPKNILTFAARGIASFDVTPFVTR